MKDGRITTNGVHPSSSVQPKPHDGALTKRGTESPDGTGHPHMAPHLQHKREAFKKKHVFGPAKSELEPQAETKTKGSAAESQKPAVSPALKLYPKKLGLRGHDATA
jgi:hypothetical protein